MPNKVKEIREKGKKIAGSVFSKGSSSPNGSQGQSEQTLEASSDTQTVGTSGNTFEQTEYTDIVTEMFDPTAVPTQTSVSGPPIPTCESGWKVTDFVKSLITDYLGEGFAPHPTYKVSL